MIRCHLTISGRVQGINFRASLREKAQSAKITGWARNVPSGEVEAILEGEEKKIRDLIEWCRNNNSYPLRVDKIQCNMRKYQGEFKKFEIKR